MHAGGLRRAGRLHAASRACGASRAGGLPDLHLRIDRSAQGRGRSPRRVGQLCAGRARAAGAARGRELRDGLHRRGGSWPHLLVRCAVLGWCAAPRLERGGLRSRCVCGPHGEDARRRAEDRAQPPEGPAECAARGRGAAVARARAGRRGDGRGNAAGHSRAAAGPAHLQPLRADRDLGRHADACRAGAGWRYRQPAPGQAHREHGRLGARPRIAARAARHGGRALHRGCRRGARLSFARRSLRRPLRCLALRQRAAYLPRGRPRAPAQRRHAGVPGPQRRPGEDPRLPRRAGRSGGPHPRARWRGRCRGRRGPGRAGGHGAARLRGRQAGHFARCGAAPARIGGQPAGVDGARAHRAARRAAAHGQRQDRSQGAAAPAQPERARGFDAPQGRPKRRWRASGARCSAWTGLRVATTSLRWAATPS